MSPETFKKLRVRINWVTDELTKNDIIDSKRPYGNAFIPGDIAEILEWEIKDDISDEQVAEAYRLHEEILNFYRQDPFLFISN